MRRRATSPSTEAAIRATVLDYYEGWYDADAARVDRALHPGLAKRSWGQDVERTPAVESLTAEQMVAWTAAGHGRAAGADRTLSIDIVDVAADIASVVAHTPVYDEYLHLVDTGDGWRIVNVLWRRVDGDDRPS